MAAKSTFAWTDDTVHRAADAYRATYDDYGDIVRYLERLAGGACKPLALARLYVEDHPASVYAPEAVEAAREVRDFLRLLVERMHELRRSLARQAFDAVWLAAEAEATAAEQEGQR